MFGRVRPQAVGIPWYRRETYAAVRARMVDADVLPETFEKFLYSALKIEKQIRAKGVPTIRVDLDTEEFAAFCRERGLHLNAEGRSTYASFVAAEMLKADPSGQA